MLRFDQEVAIITGAGQGIGLEIAKQMAAPRAAILLNYIDQKLAQEAVSTIQKQGGICEAFLGDVSDVETVQSMVAEAVRLFGKSSATGHQAHHTTKTIYGARHCGSSLVFLHQKTQAISQAKPW